MFLSLLLWLTGAFDARADGDSAASPVAPAAAAETKGAKAVQPPGAQHLPHDMVALSGSVPPPPESYDTYDGGWIRFAYPAGSRPRVQPLIVEADEAREYFRQLFGFPVLKNVTVYVARTADEMVTLAPEGSPYPGYADGVAYPYLDLVLLTVFPKQHNPEFDLKQVFKHELAHLALKDAVAGAHVPRWLNEGFAVHFSGESSLERMKTLWTASLARTLLPLRELDARFPDDAVETPIAYAESADVVRYLLRTRDRERFMAMLRRVRNGQTFDNAMSDAYGLDVPGLEEEWLSDVAKRYSFLPVLLTSGVWMGAIGLFVVGYYRRRKQQATTLKRWAVEEAAEDARVAAAAQAVPAQNAPPRMHIVIAPRDGAPTTGLMPPELGRKPEVEVPKVEHEGSWHTLH